MKRISIRTSGIHGKGVFAEEPIETGERIQYIRGKSIHKNIKNSGESRRIGNWIGAGKHTWMKTNGTPFRYINHSCNPNAAITGKRTLIALQSIPSSREITIDYSMTDADQYWQINCSCGEKECRGVIRAIYSVPTKVFERHMPYVGRYFQRAYLRSYVLSSSGLSPVVKKQQAPKKR